jgi:hypothetical protein
MERNNCITSTRPGTTKLFIIRLYYVQASTLVSVNFNGISLGTTQVSLWGYTDVTNARLKFV